MELLQIWSALIPHACFPNSAVNQESELISLTTIQAGTPLTIDYSTLFVGSTPVLKCACGFNGCRGIILGFNHLPVNFQDYYLKMDAVPGLVLTTLKMKIPLYIRPNLLFERKRS